MIIEGDIVYMPIIDEVLSKKVIVLASKPEEYGTDAQLDEDIKTFIYKWLDVPDDYRTFAVWNIKRSWVYERFHTLNYLRALGDTGAGKTRFLDSLGLLHYKPIQTSGAATAAPIFRVIDKWKGTLIMDEADLNKSDETELIIKIINMGFEKGKFVLRCNPNDPADINCFDPFCPKVLATRKPFEDKATESRCMTQVMTGTSRKDIPSNINDAFNKERSILTNKLLLWRFRNYHSINPEIETDLGIDLDPRVSQIVSSYISLFSSNDEQLELFKEYILKHQEEIIEERKVSFDGQIVETIFNIIEEEGGRDNIKSIYITNKDIIEKAGLTNYKGDKAMTPRALTPRLKSLGFLKTKQGRVNNIVKRWIPLVNTHLDNMFKRYGLVYRSTDCTAGMGESQFLKYEEKKGNKTPLPPTATSGTTGTAVHKEKAELTPYDQVLFMMDDEFKENPDKWPDKIIPIEELYKRKLQGMDEDKYDEIIKSALFKGDLYESSPGFIQKI